METETRSPFLRTALALWALGMIGGLAILPYLQSLLGQAIADGARLGHVSPTMLLAAQMAQLAVLLLIAALVGLWAARKVGLTTPLVGALAGGRRLPRFGGRMALAVLLGVLAGG